MAGGLLAALAIAAAAAAIEGEAPEPVPLQLDLSWVAPDEPEARPDIRTWKQRRRAAATRALGWMNAPLDDRELAYAHSQGRDVVEASGADEAGPILADGAEVVWNRPSLLTLGRVPGQPESSQWLRWQAAIDRARARGSGESAAPSTAK